MRNPYDYYTIKVTKQDHYHDGILRVDRRSPRLWKLVDQFAKYMQRELHYDFSMFDVNGSGDGVAAYLFGNGGVWVGACAFCDTAHAGIATATPWMLIWIWIHPYFRKRGLLTKAWPMWSQTHGDFFLLAPLSDAMKNFVKSKNIDEARVVIVR
jgi:hypothetical protein